MVRLPLSLQEELSVQGNSGRHCALSRCPGKHASPRHVLLFCPQPSHFVFQKMHLFSFEAATDIPAHVDTTYPARPGPPAVPETYHLLKEVSGKALGATPDVAACRPWLPSRRGGRGVGFCFTDLLGATARGRHRLESGAIRVPALGFRRQARWLTAPGRQGIGCSVESSL